MTTTATENKRIKDCLLRIKLKWSGKNRGGNHGLKHDMVHGWMVHDTAFPDVSQDI